MLSSRKLDDLATPAKIRALKFISAAKDAGIDLIVTCTMRDFDAQAAIYAEGRTREELDAVGLHDLKPAPGPIRTNARPGDSYHQYACALDVVPLRAGKCVWNTTGADGELWARLGAIGESCGLEWAGRWTGHMREMAHFQYTGGLVLADFKAGKRLANGALA
jgi:peptidoglycan L-alanyl-D-glutamate endopeptidase CwlK